MKPWSARDVSSPAARLALFPFFRTHLEHDLRLESWSEPVVCLRGEEALSGDVAHEQGRRELVEGEANQTHTRQCESIIHALADEQNYFRRIRTCHSDGKNCARLYEDIYPTRQPPSSCIAKIQHFEPQPAPARKVSSRITYLGLAKLGLTNICSAEMVLLLAPHQNHMVDLEVVGDRLGHGHFSAVDYPIGGQGRCIT